MLKSWGWWVGWVAHKILVSAPVPLELTLTGFNWVGAGRWGLGFGTGLDNITRTVADTVKELVEMKFCEKKKNIRVRSQHRIFSKNTLVLIDNDAATHTKENV